MARRRQLRGFDLKHIAEVEHLVGVDEAGRGAFAGPVVAAAVVVTREFLDSWWAVTNAKRINDSKQLSAADREILQGEFEVLAHKGKIHANVGEASATEIEQLNILGATKLAMRRALEGIFPPSALAQRSEPDLFWSAEDLANYQPRVSAKILVDGLALRGFPYPHTGIVNGDGRSLTIAMASILAKVARDSRMTELGEVYPGYGFARHKGYGTEEHREALLRIGRCPEHRSMFLRNLMAKRVDPGQLDLLG